MANFWDNDPVASSAPKGPYADLVGQRIIGKNPDDQAAWDRAADLNARDQAREQGQPVGMAPPVPNTDAPIAPSQATPANAFWSSDPVVVHPPAGGKDGKASPYPGWDAVADSKTFDTLSTDAKLKAKQDFFKSSVLPTLAPGTSADDAYGKFLSYRPIKAGFLESVKSVGAQGLHQAAAGALSTLGGLQEIAGETGMGEGSLYAPAELQTPQEPTYGMGDPSFRAADEQMDAAKKAALPAGVRPGFLGGLIGGVPGMLSVPFQPQLAAMEGIRQGDSLTDATLKAAREIPATMLEMELPMRGGALGRRVAGSGMAGVGGRLAGGAAGGAAAVPAASFIRTGEARAPTAEDLGAGAVFGLLGGHAPEEVKIPERAPGPTEAPVSDAATPPPPNPPQSPTAPQVPPQAPEKPISRMTRREAKAKQRQDQLDNLLPPGPPAAPVDLKEADAREAAAQWDRAHGQPEAAAADEASAQRIREAAARPPVPTLTPDEHAVVAEAAGIHPADVPVDHVAALDALSDTDYDTAVHLVHANAADTHLGRAALEATGTPDAGAEPEPSRDASGGPTPVTEPPQQPVSHDGERPEVPPASNAPDGQPSEPIQPRGQVGSQADGAEPGLGQPPENIPAPRGPTADLQIPQDPLVNPDVIPPPRAKQDRPWINTDFHVPLGGGRDEPLNAEGARKADDQRKTYIDHGIPEWKWNPEAKKWANQWEEMDDHEIAEEKKLDELGYGGPGDAHDTAGNAATETNLDRQGIPEKSYAKHLAPDLKQAQERAERGESNLPPDLDRRVYEKPEYKALLDKNRPAGQEVAPEGLRFQEWMGRVAKRHAMEDTARGILEDMEAHGESPQETANHFWSDTYFRLPHEVQRRFRKMLESHTGLDVSDVAEAAKDIDVGNKAENLEGTDRGFVALMKEANDRFKETPNVEEGRQQESGERQHQDGDESRETAEASGGDRNEQGRQVQEEVKLHPLVGQDVSYRTRGKTIRGTVESVAGNVAKVVQKTGRIKISQDVPLTRLKRTPFAGMVDDLTRAKFSIDRPNTVSELSKSLSKAFGRDVKVEQVPPPNDASRALGRAVKRMFGHDVVFVRTKEGAMRGVYVGGDKVFVNADATRPHAQIVGHELLHSLRDKLPDTYDALVKAVNDHLNSGPADTFKKELTDLYKNAGLNQLGDRAKHEELMAEVMAEHFGDPKFLRELQKTLEPSVARRVYAHIADFIDQLLSRIKGGAEGFSKQTSEFVKNLQETREAVKQALTEMADRPQGGSEATGGAFDRGKEDPKLAVTYHGTPHEFDRFDREKIGSGEGAQAYGHGLYFADNEHVAGAYRDKLQLPPDITNFRFNGRDFIKNGEYRDYNPRNSSNDEHVMGSFVEQLLMHEGDLKTAALEGKDREFAKKVMDDLIQGWKEDWPEGAVAAEKLRDKIDSPVWWKMKVEDHPANLYTVDIPDEAVSKMLDWDKPFSRQPASVKEALRSSGIYKEYRDNLSDFSSPQHTRGSIPRGEYIYNYLAHKLGSEKAASEELNRLGIPGLRYLDAGSRDAKRGTRNTVVFDDTIPKITHRNGESVTPEERQQVLDASGSQDKVPERPMTEPIDTATNKQEPVDGAQGGITGKADIAQDDLENKARFDLDPAQDRSNEDPFYSQLNRTVQEARGAPRMADASSWKQWLDGAQNRGGLKKEERDWLGIDEWLDHQKGPISRQALQDFARENQVRLGEITKGGAGTVSQDMLHWLEATDNVTPENSDGWMEYSQKLERAAQKEQSHGRTESANDYFKLSEEANRLAENLETPSGDSSGATKYSSYQLPGGSNYREMLLTLPREFSAEDLSKRKKIYDEYAERMSDLHAKTSNYDSSPQERQDAFDEGSRLRNERDARANAVAPERETFDKSHWNEPNVLAHVRMNDRVDADGKKTLHVEEIQSDWHQKGRREGYSGQRMTPDQAIAHIAELEWSYPDEVKDKYGYSNPQDYVDLATQKYGVKDGVPDAPFKQSWPMLAMKRAIRYAAENGYDRVTWTPGQLQADRYSLSNHVDAVHYNPETQRLVATKDGARVLDKQAVQPKELPDLIGKEAADKIMQQQPNVNGLRTLEGENLKVGGGGMKGFYDKMLPNEVNKYIKKWGAKVDTSDIRTGVEKSADNHIVYGGQRPGHYDVRYADGTSFGDFSSKNDAESALNRINKTHPPSADIIKTAAVHSLDITPEMRKSVMEGQPMFDLEKNARFNMDPEANDQEDHRADNPIGRARNFMEGVQHEAAKIFNPMAAGTDRAKVAAKDWANADRKARWRGQQLDEHLVKEFTPEEREAMGSAQDEQSVLEQTGKDTQGKGLDRLTPKQRDFVERLNVWGKDVWEKAKQAGLVAGDGIPSYMPRYLVNVDEEGRAERLKGSGERSVDQGGNITTSSPNLKQRNHLLPEETEAAAKAKFGSGASLITDIRALPMALSRLERATAGRELINEIKRVGQQAGEDLVSDSKEPGYFTINHPAFEQFRPKMVRNNETGKMEPAIDQNGNMSFDRVPIYVSKEFEGPLRAIMSERPGAAYAGLMRLKGLATSTIMYSPFIHNAVEWGRALPAMPGKVATFRIYFEGNRAKKDFHLMSEAIDNGLVPIGKYAGHQDITSLVNEPDLNTHKAQSLFGVVGNGVAKAIGKVNPEAAETFQKKKDAFGNWYHNTLLWDRVGDLQMGLYVNLKDYAMKHGLDENSAGKVAAHLANRYAGALPKEVMSQFSTKAANLALFSRQFTLGNLGVLKDMVTGLPGDVRAQIERDSGPAMTKMAARLSRRKSIATFLLDVGLMYASNSILQDAVQNISGQKSGSQIVDGYVDRLHAAMQKVGENPAELLDPFSQNFALWLPGQISSTYGNEPNKQDRVAVGHNSDGTVIYMRNPVGKVGEDFKNWITSPLKTLRNKESTLVRAADQILSNDAGFGRRIYDPNIHNMGDALTAAGKIATAFMKDQLPTDSAQSLIKIASGQEKAIDAYKVLGPMVGLTFSKGATGGPDVGVILQQEAEHKAQMAEVLPEVHELIDEGKIDEAKAKLEDLHLNPRQAAHTIANREFHRMSPNRLRDFIRQATPEQREQYSQLKSQEELEPTQ